MKDSQDEELGGNRHDRLDQSQKQVLDRSELADEHSEADENHRCREVRPDDPKMSYVTQLFLLSLSVSRCFCYLLSDADGEALEAAREEAAHQQRPFDGERAQQEVERDTAEAVAAQEHHEEAEAREDGRMRVDDH